MGDKASSRLKAIRVLLRVIADGQSLDQAEQTDFAANPAERALVRAMVYGVLRDYFRLSSMLDQLLQKPLKLKDQDLLILLLIGLFQIQQHRTPDYAVVSDSVNTAVALKKQWAKGLVNAVLRSFIRRREAIEQQSDMTASVKYSSPGWLLEQVQQDWPEHWESVLSANNLQAPMVLRVNQSRLKRDEYLEMLSAAGLPAEGDKAVLSAICLDKPCDVEQLPGFARGLVSVQDTAAQWAASLINPQPGQRVLDACAAPGGKTMHLLEVQPQVQQLDAIDSSYDRAQKIHQNLSRLMPDLQQLSVKVADAANLSEWWDQQVYDAVLLDAPCSGTGVIRRHPDIQLLRRPDDIPELHKQQWRLLTALWETVAVGGRLLYCTCSVLKTENEKLITRFLADYDNAEEEVISVPGVLSCSVGVQFLPGVSGTDGFYYALLRKTA